jgi:hypothetical protein
MNRKQVRYSLGIILVAADLDEFQLSPFKALERARLNPGSVKWTSGDSYSLIASEQAANDIVAAIHCSYADNLIEDGLRPVAAVHGTASYERYVLLTLNESEKTEFRAFLAGQVGCDLSEISEIEDAPDQRLRRI